MRPSKYLYNKGQYYLDRIREKLDEPEVVSRGQEGAVFGETGGVDIGHVAVCWPDPLAGGAQDAGPRVPLDLLNLKKREKKISVFSHSLETLSWFQRNLLRLS